MVPEANYRNYKECEKNLVLCEKTMEDVSPLVAGQDSFFHHILWYMVGVVTGAAVVSFSK